MGISLPTNGIHRARTSGQINSRTTWISSLSYHTAFPLLTRSGRSVSIHHFKEMINCFESPGGNSVSGATKPLDPREARGAHRSRGACFRGAEPGLMAQSSPRRIAGHRACASSDWGGTHPLPVAPTPPAGPRRHADGSLPAALRPVRKHWTGRATASREDLVHQLVRSGRPAEPLRELALGFLDLSNEPLPAPLRDAAIHDRHQGLLLLPREPVNGLQHLSKR